MTPESKPSEASAIDSTAKDRHDIRNHLAAIRGSTEVALLEGEWSPSLKDTLERTLQSVDSIVEILRRGEG
jgi:hypothetical protein